MNDFESMHPRAATGNFTDKEQSEPDSGVALLTRPVPGGFPVHLEDLPDVENYRFTAAALGHGHGEVFVPYFTKLEMDRVIVPINALEAESDDPQPIRFDGQNFYIDAAGVPFPLLRQETPSGPAWSTDTDGGTRAWEITEGQWFADGGTDTNFTEVTTDRAEGNTFDRAWTIRRDDDRYVTRVVTWFVEKYENDSDDSQDGEEEPTISYSVFDRTEDAVSTSYGGDLEIIEDLSSEDHLTTDRVFDTVEQAEQWAKSRANGADGYFHVSDWDGYPAQ